MRLPFVITLALLLLAVPLVAAHRVNPSDDDVTAASRTSVTATVTREDLDRAARDYRIAVYNRFRRDRREFDRRNAVWRNIYAQWQRDGEPKDDIAVLVDWLRQATAVSRAANFAALPLPPEFGPTANSDRAPPDIAEVSPPVVGVPADPPTPAVEPPVAPLPRREATSPPTVRRADADDLPSAALPISPSLPPPRRADAAEIESARADASDPPRRTAPATPIEAPATSPPTPRVATPADGTDGIDVNEVAIRVAGHNLALATLAEEIARADEPSIDALVGFVERLEAQAVRANDLAPYYALVDAVDRARLRPLGSLGQVRASLASRIAQAIARWTGDAGVSSARRTEQLARLEELQRRVNQLSSTP